MISLVASAGVVAGAATLHAVDPATAAPRSGVPATAIPAGSSAVATERNGAQSPATVPAAAAVPPVAAPGADPFPGGFVPQTQTHGS